MLSQSVSSKKLALKVEGVSKSFRLPTEKASGIKQAFINRTRGIRGYTEQKVLCDISFDVKKGDFFGIVGRNGSGKSTLLKLISQIYTPDKGAITVNGTLVPFIELGVGFNPELTGRENVYLNGALLGFSRNQIDKMYDEIVDFAELQDFMDQKLKNYSSGMQVRLAFSVAIRARGDILVLDEVLAVGDEAFQRKCYSYFNKLKREKRTVVLVTHDMSAVESFCNRAMLIDKGAIACEGDPHIVAAQYARDNDRNYVMKENAQKNNFEIRLLGEDGKKKDKFDYNERMIVRLEWRQKRIKNVGIAIFRDNGEFVFGPNTYQDKYLISGDNTSSCMFELNLNKGEYFIKAGIMGDNDKEMVSFIEEGPHFLVGSSGSSRWGGVTRLNYKWDHHAERIDRPRKRTSK